MKKTFLSHILLLFFMTPALAEPAKPSIFVMNVEGVINPVIGAYIEEGLSAAVEQKAAAVLIELNTPGGLLDTTRSIITSMINSELPVIVYVTPRGSRATSAGVFITMAADVAAMAPETHIGAAHPVTVGGEDPFPSEIGKKNQNGKEKKPKGSSVMSEKMVSDAAAYIRTLATERGRNAEWAEKAVRESVSLTSDEAVKEKVIDIVAASPEKLISKINGETIKKNGKEIKIQLKDAPFKLYPMSRAKKFLHMIAHPNIAYILMMIGIYGLIYELASPGIGLGGGIGLICLLLAFFSLQVLPINTVGMALMVAGVVFLLLELLAPSHGLLTLAGLIAFALGSFMLIDIKTNPYYARVSIELILSTVGTTALFFGYAIRKAFQARKAPTQTGVESLIGSIGVAQTDLSPEGMVFFNGELWTARADETVSAHEEIIVTGVEGNKLFVKKV